MNKLLNNLLGMYKQAKMNKKAEEIKEKIIDEYKVEYIPRDNDKHNYELGDVVRISVIENGFVCGAYYVDTIMKGKDGITMYSGDTRKDDLILTAEQRKKIQDWIKSFSKQSSKNTKLTKKASAFKVVKMTNNDFVDLSDSIKDVGDELWGIVYGKIVHVVAVIVFENKVLYEPLINDEETQKIYDEAQTGSIETLELLPGDDTYADIGFVVKESFKRAKLTKKAEDKEFYKEYKEEIKSRLDKDNRIDSYVFSDDDRKVNIRIKDSKMGYRKTGFISLVQALDIEYLMDKVNADGKEMKTASKAKLVRKQAENKEIVVTYEGTNGKEYIVKAPNGLYFNEYVDTDTQHSRGAGPFETLEKAKEMFKKHRPSAKEIVVTKKKAVLQESENGLGYVLPNGSVVYPGDQEYLQSELKGDKELLEKTKSEIVRLEKEMEEIKKEYPEVNLSKYPDSILFKLDRELKLKEAIELSIETIEDILNAFKNKKMGKQATIKHENGVYNVYSESGKCLGKGYKTKEEAEKRLKQVEYFKHKSSLKQVVISKMAKSLKDIPESVKKNILSDLVYVILTGKGSFAYKTVAKKLETIIKELGYGDRLKANEDGSLPTNEIVELISKEPKAMELAGKFANITRAF